MHVAVYVALALAVACGLASRAVARWLAPRAAAITLAGGGAASAAGWVWTLGLLTATLVDELPRAAIPRLHMASDPVPTAVAVVAAVLLAWAAGRCLEAVMGEVRRVRLVRSLRLACPADGGSDLVIIHDPAPRAFALPQLTASGGKIVVSSAMLRALGAEQRAVLLAHERSHLRNRHSWFRTVATLACALQPALGRLDVQLDGALERWADEDSAAAVGHRRTAAESLGRAAAVAGAGHPSPLEPGRRADPGPSARVAALLDAAPRSSRSSGASMVALVAIVLLLGVSTVEASTDLEDLFGSGQHQVAAVTGQTPTIYYVV